MFHAAKSEHASPRTSLLILAATLLAGCSPSGPEMGHVSGTITLHDGTPVTAGTVQFWPENGRPSRGSIAEDGTYQLTTFDPEDGALVGKHQVTIKATRLSEPQPEIKSTAAEIEHFSQKNAKTLRAARVGWIVPQKYSEVDTTPLTATVESGENEVNFQIEKD